MMLPMSPACSEGQFPGASPRGMIPKQFSRMPPLGVSIRGAAGVEKSLGLGRNIAGSQQGMHKNELQDKIKKQLRGVQLSPSSYDTAWVAMVPVQGSPQTPCFPQCIKWILQNQCDDGSWGTNQLPGQNFIGRNFSVAMDEQTVAPVGFNITFSGLLSLATGTGLEFPVMQTDIDGIFHLRKIELERDAYGTASSRRAFMAYVSEGLGNLQDWDQVMAYQRKNGSIFNSPSATAATVIHGYNDRALSYLDSLTSKFGGPVPVMYPQNTYSQLCMVDTLEKTGISQNFACEISDILDMTYRLWMHNEEELMLDMRTCAMAFRLLRMHGYDITSDGMAQFVEQSSFDGSIHGYLNDTKALLELYQSSQVRCLEDDLILENIGSWSARVLQEKISSKMIHKSELPEVEYALRVPVYATLERLEHKRNIQQFKTKEQLKIEGFKLLKSGYCGVIANDEILALAVDEFHSSQSVYQQDLQDFKSWVAQTRLNELKSARIMPLITYFSGAATMFPSELSEARIVWAQNCILTTIADDFFDGEGSKEEMENLVKLIEKWDGHGEIGFSSERVEIIFDAIYNTSKQTGEKAVPLQKRNAVDQIAEMWWFTVRGMLTEAEWRMDKYVPTTMVEYMSAAVDSFALGPLITSAVLFVGPELSEEVVRSEEYVHLLRLANTIGRLLNDTQTYEKEIKMGKVNSIMLHALPHGGGGTPEASIEEAKREIRRVLQGSRCELLRLVTRDGGVVPPPCRKLFWFISKIVHFAYLEKDNYFSPEGMMASANAVILDPLQLRVTLPPSGSGTL